MARGWLWNGKSFVWLVPKRIYPVVITPVASPPTATSIVLSASIFMKPKPRQFIPSLTFMDYARNGLWELQNAFEKSSDVPLWGKALLIATIPIAPFFWMFFHIRNDMCRP